ncbi:uncharacterized protein PpBr36_06315 [Pyricularia pennisetigena]|uniref:uncharacterized protein n=1 Tax=Pyricularia pennisetigena TaxID=1578925 RepID=UPI00114DEDD3|nr:uncharacterized protein PpBr36_06315 [Pyricularia pennisetigena]TLS22953.1 hypothetical protein PpBr36_06315 [Pyricularia pennisetigena]
MPNWKELGEVPDSDEDDFDGPSPPQSPIAGLLPAPPPPIASPLTDIWSIPSSPARRPPEPGHRVTPTSTTVPLGTETTTPLSCSSPLSPPPPDVTSSPTLSPQPESSRHTVRENLQKTLPAHRVPSDTVTGAQKPLESESILHITSHNNAVSPSRQAAVRLERSLRPRKPIQEHPYLLEGAQYTQFMKAHGFKPLRVVTEQAESSRRLTTNEDSQDNDFSADDSQEHESQPLDAASIVEERDELALSPSPRLSSQFRAISSGQPSPGQDTADTSPAEDDLPSIDELLRQSRKTLGKKQSKRLGSTSISSCAKRRRIDGSARKDSITRPRFKPPLAIDLEASPLAGQEIRRRSRNPQVPNDADITSPTKIDVQQSFPATTPFENGDAPAVISISDDDVQAEVSDSPDSSGTDSDSDSMQKHVRRIRGVLPASWLRLDQLKAQKTRDGTSRRQSPPSSPKHLPRKGVALPKQRPQQSTSSNALFDFLSNDDDDDHDERINNDILLRRNSSLVSFPKTNKNPDLFRQLFLDDGDIPEEDVIDRMVTGTKRKRKDSSEPKNRTYRKHNSGLRNPRQQKITTLLDSGSGGDGSALSKKAVKSSRSIKTKTARRSRTTKRHPTPPPMLSVLDVVESDAPQFLRIAARAARRAPNRGKTSPSRKQINLGSRPDNIDALSVLRDWKTGRIRPRVAHEPMDKASTSTSTATPSRFPLTQRSTNPPRASAHLKRAASLGDTKRRTKQTQLNVSSTTISSTAPIVRAHPKHLNLNSGIGRSDTVAARPAQLETTEVNRSGKFSFLAQKRNLDASYRRNKSSVGLAAARLDRFINSPVNQDMMPTAVIATSTGPPKELQPLRPRRPRLRKQTKARFVDITAPQFVHAADPLPPASDYVLVHEDDVGESSDEKLRGLGPFGTHYTHHFEIFPLDANVYFHESTFIGMGKLSKLQDQKLMDKSCHVRPRISFQLGDKTLRWGPWDEITSSELGVLVDFVVDKIIQPESTLSLEAVAASDFLLNFVETAVSFEKSTDMSSFMSRVLDVLHSFIDRVEASLNGRARPGSSGLFRTLLQVLPRVLLVNLLSTRLCQQSSVLSDQTFQAQEVLRRLAKVACRILVSLGLGSVEETYADLQQLHHREHGIKSDRGEVVLWVVLMRILQAAELPRGGFWDILGSVILTPELTSTSDLKKLECGWKHVFTLLPLTEFNDLGTLDAGSRLRLPLEGWAIPQALLKRTFHIYQKNPRQPPSFNDYCRSLMARCHYLIDQWGWGKCIGMVGLVFDFFGSQNLSHLRNEEVYKSPLFLEQLSGKPDVSIHAEDRCFHIFVKIVTMVIRRLRASGLVRDIKNLVARIVPNHSRQFLKEQTINQHELAALRNHHDLLCALFWAAPPDLRPGIHLIEKLVVPGSSHREAVLINLRAWSQLSRFVVSSNEGSSVFRPFISWQNNIFRQTLDQYLTAETDIQQQLLALSKDASNDIDRDMVGKMIEKNKAAAMDILYCSVQASLEVLKVAPSLAAATYSLNTKQLSQVFTKFDVSCAGFDWQTLLIALDIMGRYIDRIDDILDYQDSCNSETAEEQNASDEAIQLVDDQLVEALFSVANQLLNLLETRISERIGSKESLCAEKAIVLSGRIASRLLQVGVTRLSRFFSPGKYGLFQRMPQDISLVRRRYLPLFTATLVRNGTLDFKDLNTTPDEMWLLCLTGPRSTFEHVSGFGDCLRRHSAISVGDAACTSKTALDYNLARDLFASAVSSQRKALREDQGSLQRRRKGDLAKALKAVMEQMKRDLATVKPNRTAHIQHVDFVREIIGLVKSYGVDVCPVDPFFYRISADYSPSLEDPQLHLAGILAYGIRFQEGDTKAYSQLFYYLYNNCKVAVVNNKIANELDILQRCMENIHIFDFMLSCMLPTVVRATLKIHEAWPLLQLYSGALRQLLERSCLPIEIQETRADAVVALLSTILLAIRTLKTEAGNGALSTKRLFLLVELMGIVEVLQPTLVVWSMITEGSIRQDVATVVSAFSSLCDSASDALIRLGREDSAVDIASRMASASVLLDGIREIDEQDITRLSRVVNANTESLSTHVCTDVQRSWIVTDRRVCVRAPGNTASQASASQGLQGLSFEPLDMEELYKKFSSQVLLWKSRAVTNARDTRGRRFNTKRNNCA